MPSRHCHSPFRKVNSGSGCEGGLSGSGRRMPLGRPVVPDEYSIAVPSDSSAIGVSGYAEMACSKSIKRGSPSERTASPPSTTRQHFTRGHNASAARARGSLAMEVTSSCDSLLSTM